MRGADACDGPVSGLHVQFGCDICGHRLLDSAVDGVGLFVKTAGVSPQQGFDSVAEPLRTSAGLGGFGC
jgi:hypothetical protein